MSESDVSGGGMNRDELSEQDLERLLAGDATDIAVDHLMAEFVVSARQAVLSAQHGEPSMALRQFLEAGTEAGPATVTSITAAGSHRRRKLLAAFTATAAGKVAVGVAIAAAATTGAYAARLIDVPILPDVTDDVVVVADEPEPPATSVVPLTTRPTEPESGTTQTVVSQPDSIAGPSGQQVDLFVTDVGSVSVSIEGDSVQFLAAELLQRWSFESVQVVGDHVLLTIFDGTDRVTVTVRSGVGDIVVQVRDVRSGDEVADRYSLDGQRLPEGHADTSTAPTTPTTNGRRPARIDEPTTTRIESTTTTSRTTTSIESTTTSIESTTTSMVSTTQTDRPAVRDDQRRRDQSEVTRSQDTARESTRGPSE